MNTIHTSKAKCRDCHRCIRACPVKSVGMKDGQSWVIDQECILCGQCISECPQKARYTPSQLDVLRQLTEAGQKVVVGLAPSYLAAWDRETFGKIVNTLRRLGVFRIEETAVGAIPVAKAYGKLLGRGETVISSCCPSAVNLIKSRYPGLAHLIAPVASPMVAHARLVKARFGAETRYVFVGPCLAKKEEAFAEGSGDIDAVLTFQEVEELVSQSAGFEASEPGKLDLTAEITRLFPVENGVLISSGMGEGLRSNDLKVISVNGVKECMSFLDDLQKHLAKPAFVELMVCRGGCIGGPFMPDDAGLMARRCRLQNSMTAIGAEIAVADTLPKISVLKRSNVSEERKPIFEPGAEVIQEILLKMGKRTPEDETNCGGCGYESCRQKARAVALGMAEIEMCVPYMKAKAESLSLVVVDTSPNAIIVVNKDMVVQEMNPAADKLFNPRRIGAKEHHLSEFMDPGNFRDVWETQNPILGKLVRHEDYGLLTRQTLYPLKKYELVVGVITDITEEEKKMQEAFEVRKAAIEKANSVIREQMKVAQDIAGLLGETTAGTKATLLELVSLMEQGR